MKLTMPRTVMHGASPAQTNRYTELEIQEFNRHHDSALGWSEKNPTTYYTNADRRAETTHLPAKDVWKERA